MLFLLPELLLNYKVLILTFLYSRIFKAKCATILPQNFCAFL